MTNNSLLLSGGEGQHGKDIRFRNTLSGVELTGRKEHSNIEVNQATHGIIIPISATKQLIEIIVNLGQDENIINFCGVMSTTPENIRANHGIENIHFLFGPKTIGNLKVCIAHSGTNLTPLFSKIVDNSKKQDIKIIETDIDTHDKNMAFVQGLHHLVRQILNQTNPQLPISPIGTNQKTIDDMILFNPFMNGIISQFKGKLNNETVDLLTIFQETLEENLTEEEIQTFGTPKCLETLNFARKKINIIETSTADIHAFINKMLSNNPQ